MIAPSAIPYEQLVSMHFYLSALPRKIVTGDFPKLKKEKSSSALGSHIYLQHKGYS